jgi:V/A-type H+-transporting ATPase subunit G/H
MKMGYTASVLARARQRLAEAEEAGKTALEAALAKADSELQQLRRKAEAEGRSQEDDRALELRRQEDELRKKAESRLDAAAALIVERIVND